MTTKSPIQAHFDDLVRSHVRPLLKGHGFAHAGNNFRRRWPDGWHIFNIQRSQWSNRESISFTFNLAVSVDSYAAFRGLDPAKPPLEYECPIRIRIGRLITEGRDYWWELHDRTLIPFLAREINIHLREAVLPWFVAQSSLDAIARLVQSELTGVWANPLVLLATIWCRESSKLQPLLERLRLNIEQQPPGEHVGTQRDELVRLEQWCRQQADGGADRVDRTP